MRTGLGLLSEGYMKNIYMKPEEIKDFWESHPDGAYMQHKVAEYEERDVEVYISIEDDVLRFTTIKGGNVCGEYSAYEPDDIDFIFEEIEGEDLSPIIPEEFCMTAQEKIAEREEELNDLITDFVYNITNGDEGLDPEGTERFKDMVCELLYREFGISVRRPMVLQDEDGNESVSEYPYDEIDFDDPENRCVS